MKRSLSTQVIGRSRKFLNGLLGGADKRRLKVIPELVQGILASGSLVLSQISRALVREGKSLKGLENHFSRQLSSPYWRDGNLRERMLRAAAPYVGPNTLIAVDLSDIAKPRARTLEGLGWMWDGSEGKVGWGYWTFEAYARLDDATILPLLNYVYTLEMPPLRSEVGIAEESFRKLVGVLGRRGIYLMDRGFDGWELFSRLEPLEVRFITRLRGDRSILDESGEPIGLEEEVARRVPCSHWMPHKKIALKIGYTPVRIPNLKRTYTMVVAWFPDAKNPLMLLTTEPVRNALEAEKIVRWYFQRWSVEEAIRIAKQEMGLETVRVYAFHAIERLVQMAYLAMLVLVVIQQLPEKSVAHLKRLWPTFRRECRHEYYRLIWGLRALFGTLAPCRIHL